MGWYPACGGIVQHFNNEGHQTKATACLKAMGAFHLSRSLPLGIRQKITSEVMTMIYAMPVDMLEMAGDRLAPIGASGPGPEAR